LMQGGTVVLDSASFDVNLRGKLTVKKQQSGLEDWLAHNGITLGKSMILDKQNSAFPVPVERKVGMFTVQETKLINYPYFVDIRQSGMTDVEAMLSGINQLTMNWSSPIQVDTEKNKGRRVVKLLQSSPESWTSDSLNIQPDYKQYGENGFQLGSKLGEKTVGLMVEGKFSSWFSGKPSPLLTDKKKSSKEKEPKEAKKEKKDAEKLVLGKVLEHSPASARILLFSSNDFLTDTSIAIASSVRHTEYDAPVRLVANLVDWSLEDRGLLAIRGRGQFARTLHPMARNTQIVWEYLNYALALAGLVLIWLLQRGVRKRSLVRYQQLLESQEKGVEI